MTEDIVLLEETIALLTRGTTEPHRGFGVHIWDLKSHHCRWIEGTVNGLDTLYCGVPRQRGSAYCPDHTRRAWR